MAIIHTVILPPGDEALTIEHPLVEQASLFFIGTATVLLRYAGFTVLTDPNFLHQGDHIHLGYGLRATRLTDPALTFEELPPLDLVVLSHLHEDHFDRLVARKLDKFTHIITNRQAARALEKKGFRRTYPLDQWETISLRKGERQLNVTAMPAKHAPGLLNKALPPVMGSLLDFEVTPGKRALRLYITGDTLIHDHLKEIPQRYPDIDLALLHLGGTKILGVLLTMDAKQGVEAIKMLNLREVVPIHYNDYNIFKSPLADFKKAVEEAGLAQRVHYLEHGETYIFEVPASRY